MTYEALARNRLVKALDTNASNAERLAELERASDKLEATLKTHTESQIFQHGRRAVMREGRVGRELARDLHNVNCAMMKLAWKVRNE